jgi:hypothetical protein
MAGNYEAMLALCERARRACAEACAARQQLDATRREARALIQEARVVGTSAAWEPCDRPAEQPAREKLYLPRAEPSEAALGTLRIMRALLSEYPIEWQVKLVKVLAARTAAVAYDHLHAQRALSA